MRHTVDQRSPEWHALRDGRLTASDFAAAIGISPYCSRAQLWRIMTGKVERNVDVNNPAIAWGIANEPAALSWYECETGHLLLAGGFWTHDEHDWLGASPDGEHVDYPWIAEAKCPGKLHTSVPDYYLCQTQGQLEITTKNLCAFISWTPDEQDWFPVKRDPDYWAWMFPLLQEFWHYVQTDQEPPRLKAKPVYQPKEKQ